MGWISELKSKITSDYDDYEDSDGIEENMPLADSNSRGRKKGSRDEFSLRATTQLSVVLCRPRVFDDASGIAEQLRSKHTVIINLEKMDAPLSRRMLDFLAGAAFITSGKLTKIATGTYMLLPYELDLEDEVLSELAAQDFRLTKC